MAKAVAARIFGDDYQALVFWLEACKMLIGEDDIECVEIESNDVKSLDDVVVHYHDGHRGSSGRIIRKAFYQVKYHVDYRNSLSASALVDPGFINASSVSFLKRAKKAWDDYRLTGLIIVLYNTWGIDSTDVLGELISSEDGHFEVEKMMTAKPRSKIGKLRDSWAKHLECDAEELEDFLGSIRIVQGGTLSEVRAALNDRLARAGLKTMLHSNPLSPYADLARALIKSERTRLNRDQLIECCKESKLWDGGPWRKITGKALAIRSRERGTGGFDSWGDARLDLLPYFKERALCSGLDWSDDVGKRIVQFLARNARIGDSVTLWLPAHYTVFALAGYALDARSGVAVTVRQLGTYGVQEWAIPLPEDNKCGASVCLRHNDIKLSAVGTDLAVAIGVSQEISGDVEEYLKGNVPSVRVLRTIELEHCGSCSIQGPGTAASIVDEIVCSVRSLRQEYKCRGVTHIFYAMPAFMVFMIGQRIVSMGAVQLYEHDFDSGLGAAYSPSLTFPLKKGY